MDYSAGDVLEREGWEVFLTLKAHALTQWLVDASADGRVARLPCRPGIGPIVNRAKPDPAGGLMEGAA